MVVQHNARVIGVLAGATNFGLLLFNLCFTRADAIAAPNPNVFSPFGQIIILAFGVAFALAGLGDAERDTPSMIWWAFAFEKSLFVIAWLQWMAANDLAALFREAERSDDLKERTPTRPLLLATIDLRLFAAQAPEIRRSHAPRISDLVSHPAWQDYLVPMFHALYGLIDFTFLVLFVYLGLQYRPSRKPGKKM